MVIAKYIRGLGYVGPSEVTGELGEYPNHLLRRDNSMGDTKTCNKGENSKQVARHFRGEDIRSEK